MVALTVGDDKFFGLAELFDLALLVLLVGLLPVDEEVGGARATHPLVEDGLVGLLVERLLRKDKQIQIRRCPLRAQGAKTGPGGCGGGQPRVWRRA